MMRALPLFLIGALILWHASYRWKTRFRRGNGRPAIKCPECGEVFQRGLPFQIHLDEKHSTEKVKRKKVTSA